MKNTIFRNKEFKVAFCVLLAIMAVFTSIMFFISNILWTRMKNDLINNNIILMEKLISSYPAMENEIIGAFTKIPDSDVSPESKEKFSNYGYDTALPVAMKPIVGGYYIKNIYGGLLLCFLQAAALSAVIFFSFRKFFIKISNITAKTDKIMNGDMDITFRDDGEGELPLLCFHLNQLTERLKLSLESLMNEKEYIKDMVSGISHQLKTPLTSLRMYNDLLLEEFPEQVDTRKEFLVMSSLQLDRMEWLIETILKIARLEVNAVVFRMEEQSLIHTLRETVNSLRIQSESKNLKVEIIKNQEEIILYHDPRWLGEAVGNIIRNSIEYTPEYGNITIRAEADPYTVTVTIADTGIGIPKDEIPHLFERFYQGKTARMKNVKSTGIGLSLSELVVKKHEGVIRVESEVNCGTRFMLIFPSDIAALVEKPARLTKE